MSMTTCPVCSSQKLEEMLSLVRQPVYQHPVSDEKKIPPPHFMDLSYFFCQNCDHSFQKSWDISILERIYKQYYYTPRPTDIGVLFQNQFVQAFVDRFHLSDSFDSILEIGCSSGEMLARIAGLFPDKILAGFEPNRETAAMASASGVHIYREFFTALTSQKVSQKFDIIFHRHVIEHVADFDDFFAAHQNVSHDSTRLIVETPCLNWSTHHLSMAPFHIEHLHVFSIRSLTTLLKQYGWFLDAYLVTANGHLIGLFTRKNVSRMIPAVENPFGLSVWIEKNKSLIYRAAEGKKLALWGAGSGGVKVMNYFNLCPDIIVDSNPNKAGKKFVGYPQKIVAADGWIEQWSENSESWLIIVASTYFEEIRQRLKGSGWKGKIIQPYAL
jgi:2-polyprenyl-3-methyl-5-hydroxy-6-metoxy-1,4-benzoquinol methylase